MFFILICDRSGSYIFDVDETSVPWSPPAGGSRSYLSACRFSCKNSHGGLLTSVSIFRIPAERGQSLDIQAGRTSAYSFHLPLGSVHSGQIHEGDQNRGPGNLYNHLSDTIFCRNIQGVYCWTGYSVTGKSDENLRGGYFLYFPFLWLLTDKRNFAWLWRTLLISTIVGSIVYVIKGYIGYGENVYIRETTGVRVATRQPNAFAVSALGILSASNVAERTGTETGSYLTDTSTLSRIMAWSAIIEELHGPAMISGKGFGALYTCFRPDLGTILTVYYVDSTYFQIALNMGLIGLIVLLGIFISALVKAARLFLRTSSKQRAGISLGIFSAIIMLLFAAGFASVLTNYRYTVLWAFMLAILQNEIILEERGNA